MEFLKRFVWDCRTLAIPLVFVAALAVMLALLGYPVAAYAVNYLGTVLVVLGNVAYIVFYDSRKRWKGVSSRDRLVRLLTFRR